MATASGVLGPKQTKGYFVTVGALSTTVQYNIAPGTGAGGSYQPGAITNQVGVSGAANIGVGVLLKDMGKTVLSSVRTYRKVQVVTGATYPSTGITTAAQGVPFYIELPTGTSMSNASTQVAYLPGLM